MKLLLIAALLAAPPASTEAVFVPPEDAPVILKVKSGMVQTADGELVEVGTGAYLDTAAVIEVARHIQGLEERQAVAHEQASLGALVTWGPIILIAAGLGGYAVGRWGPR